MQWSKKKSLNGIVKLNPFCTEFHSQEPLDQMTIVLRNQNKLLPWNIIESGVNHHTLQSNFYTLKRPKSELVILPQPEYQA